MSPSALHGQTEQPGVAVETPRGIAGLKGREPVGVAVSIGVRSERGFPVEKDRFHLVLPREVDRVRPHHPSFARYNTASPESRRVLRVTLVHVSPNLMFRHSLKAQVLPGMAAHPNRRPACVGDGVRAVRWSGDDPSGFQKIACPHDRCQYRQPDGRKPSPCKPNMVFIFQLRTTDELRMPSMLAKFTSGGWNTVANFVGFFEHLANVCGAASGGSLVSLVGFPALMTLQEQTNPAAKTKFPVVRITPEVTPDEFVRRRAALAAMDPPRSPARIQDQTDADLADDVRSLAGPITVPGRAGQ